MITIVLAEDHQVVREGLRALLEKESDFRIVAEARDGTEAIEKITESGPDVLLLDLTLPRLHGLNVLSQIRGRKRLKVVVLSMHRDDASVLEALRLGARAYVLKDSPASELVGAIRSVIKNEMYVSPPLRELVHRAALNIVQGNRPKENSGELTRRERMVLQLAAEGKRNEAVAIDLGISIRTAEKHRANVMRKLQLHTQSEILLYALRHNIVQT